MRFPYSIVKYCHVIRNIQRIFEYYQHLFNAQLYTSTTQEESICEPTFVDHGFINMIGRNCWESLARRCRNTRHKFTFGRPTEIYVKECLVCAIVFTIAMKTGDIQCRLSAIFSAFSVTFFIFSACLAGSVVALRKFSEVSRNSD